MELVHGARDRPITPSLSRQPPPSRAATLLLEDGSYFRGFGLGASTMVAGELIFTTSMTGYHEALTDPSYRGQLLMFTYPLIGNYGVAGRAQSGHIQPQAVIMAMLSESWAERRSLRENLVSNNVPALHGVDTRAIARHIRQHGAMPAVLSVHPFGLEPSASELRRVLRTCAYDSTDYTASASVSVAEVHGYGDRRIALLDCGNKQSVIDELVRRGLEVILLPAQTPTAEILAWAPRGLIISNGPGNPGMATSIVDTIRELYGRLPLFGICLGHQLLALSAGANTYKLKFGHRGANHPVQDCLTGRAFVTTQNHGFAVDAVTLPADLVVSHRNLNDGTVEGLRHRALPIRSVQFHPEGAPGPRDAGIMLDEWLDLVA
jgi:carbamoyl-phosphate synthase small subunit